MENTSTNETPSKLPVAGGQVDAQVEIQVESQVDSKVDSKADGQLTEVSLDDKKSLWTQEDDPQAMQKPRSWKRAWLNGKKNKEEKEDAKSETKTTTTTEKYDPDKDTFLNAILNVCSFGLLGSSTTTTVVEEPKTAEKIVEDLAMSEAQMTMTQTGDEEMGSTFKTAASRTAASRSLFTSTAGSDDGSSTAKESIVSLLKKNRKNNNIVFYVIGIIVFFIMCGLFAYGGVLLQRNGW